MLITVYVFPFCFQTTEYTLDLATKISIWNINMLWHLQKEMDEKWSLFFPRNLQMSSVIINY